ncbi:hypothetical protein PRZ48_009411 [Zasmidium cellare]|uniref:SH3 domain-containing protein n=1 Tax=Zasmidium cellare TaxID=395010 RepID=A0ABR0EBN7_ZASCE|nr:hypothetical protein PRZ48_009411 [Zasmidium cellare]
MASLFKVKALYDFEAKEEDDLGFPAGQIIDVTEEVDDNWLEGKYNDVTGAIKSGIFPREFVDKYEPEVPTRPSRPSRPKAETTAPAPAPVAVPPPAEPEPDVPVASKPQPPAVDIPPVASREEETTSPPSAATNPRSPPPAPKPAPAAPAEPAAAPASGKKPPPPIAAKSNAFRDRIAAFNQPAAAPLAPMVPGQKPQGNTFIKKPFVAPPPMANAYVPPPKQEPVHKPYIREEDPEIRRRLEEDRAAAESAGLTGESAQQEEDEDAPKPTSLKERIARLQQQQMEQAQRRAEGGSKEKKKPPPRKPSEPSEQDVEAEGEEMQRERSADTERQSLDVSREKPRVPSAQRRPAEPMSPVPQAPEHELVSDGNEADHSAAGETTDDAGTIGPEDSDETEAPPPPRRASTAPKKEPDVGDEEDTTEEAEDEEDSMDEETRRKLELRERMAKMSGGMGMAGMFGPPGGMPMPGGAPPKKRSTKDRKASEDAGEAPTSPLEQAPRIPMIPVPGMNRVQSPESDRTPMPSESQSTVGESVKKDEDELPLPPTRKSTHEERAPPPVPKDSRPSGAPPVPGAAASAPRPPPPESRPVPPPPPAGPLSPGPGSESDDEASMHPPKSSADESGIDTPGPLPIRTASTAAPPVPTSGSVQSPENKRSSYFGSEPQSATSDKRASRVPPPVPGSPLTSPRPPPPPPPTAIPSRTATTHEADEERGESDYEGDYDTDIASSAKHKDALKAHVREPSLDDSTTADEAPLSPPVPPPHATAPRAVPPPPPASQPPPPKSRPSMDTPRAPPPVPPVASPQLGQDEDYDPYRYDHASQRGPPPPVPGGVPVVAPPIPPREPEQRQESSADDLYSTSPPRKSTDAPSRPMPPPPSEAPPPRAAPRQSLDVQRSNTTSRRSMDAPRPSGEYNGQIAQDVNLSQDTPWWTAPHPLPPVLQSRNGVDILSESEESTTSKRGGRTTISKDIYVLYIDYSQTIINARYDPTSPTEVALEQRHLPPPPKLRQDQLETYWQRFGHKISDQVNAMGHSKKDTVVGDGSPTALVSELIKAQSAALQPVGTRAYGSLVYANLANASTMQYDEIRPGDIVTLRNARFEGSHGAMKHKYKVDYGLSHVAIVEEWDGTRRAIRGWEQGREKKDKGVRSEKFRLGDLRSGEVKVWRVVGRDWVEWESGQ